MTHPPRSERSSSTTAPRSFVLAAIAILALAACASSGGASSAWTFAPPVPTASAAAGSPGASDGPGASGSPAASEPATSSSPDGSPAASPAGSPGASQAPGEPGAPSTQPGESPAASGATGSVIELEETVDLHIVQGGQPVSELAVKAGDVITFKVTNTAGYPHSFYIGPAAQLEANDTTGLDGIPEFSSGTQEFTYTVTADTANLEFACPLPGHYQSMHGTFSVQP